MTQAELEALGWKAPEDSAQLAQDLWLVVFDLLRQCGAHV
jgi:hypothetical protein